MRKPNKRFWAKVSRRQSDDCWPWLAGRTTKGYGSFWINGKNTHAHRVAMELASGKAVPAHLVVCHSCDNKLCCNPGHLWIGSHAENIADRDRKNRHMHGENHYRAILSESAARFVRDTEPLNKLFRSALARHYAEALGVQAQTIYAIWDRRIWRHL